MHRGICDIDGASVLGSNISGPDILGIASDHAYFFRKKQKEMYSTCDSIELSSGVGNKMVLPGGGGGGALII